MSETAAGVQLPPPGSYTGDPERSSIPFTTRHLFGVAGVSGNFAMRNADINVEDPLTRSTVSVEVDAGTFDTGSTGREAKVRSASFLDVENHPAITLTSTSIKHDNGTLTLAGALTVRRKLAPLDLIVESATALGGA